MTVSTLSAIADNYDFSGFKSRLDFIIQVFSSGSVEHFAETLGNTSESTLRSYLKANSEPKLAVINRICDISNFNRDFVMAGIGPMTKDEFSTMHVYSADIALSIIKSSAQPNFQNVDKLSNTRAISSISINQAWFNYTRTDPSNCLLILAEDYAMASTLNKGDTVLVDYSMNQVREGMFFISFQGSPCFRRLMRKPSGGVQILFENSTYDSIFVEPDSDELIVHAQAKYIFKEQEI